MKRLITFVAFVLLAIPAMAQSGKVTARIVDADTKEGIIGAIMEVRKEGSQAAGRHSVSGAEGKVTVSGLAAGDYTVTIAFIGYATQTHTVKLAPMQTLAWWSSHPRLWLSRP